MLTCTSLVVVTHDCLTVVVSSRLLLLCMTPFLGRQMLLQKVHSLIRPASLRGAPLQEVSVGFLQELMHDMGQAAQNVGPLGDAPRLRARQNCSQGVLRKCGGCTGVLPGSSDSICSGRCVACSFAVQALAG